MQDIPKSILVVEDENQIRRFILSSLEAEGFTTHFAENGRRGIVEAGTRQPDVIILDLGLPDMDGVDVIKEIRSWSAAPIIVLSARTLESEKVRALDAGADDYITKPFGSSELIARVNAQIRRNSLISANNSEGIFEFGEIKADLPKRKIFRKNIQIQLTPIEFRLLSVLIKNAGCVITQRQLLKEVWGPAYIDNSHYLRVYMGHLRQKLEADPAQPKYLLTETGVGYRLNID
jgi:two-component system, OmpR family, KDP operon response regulator KdpE